MIGTIAKGIAGFYYVWADGELYECKARGKFRKSGLVPMVGDKVELSEDSSSSASKPFMKAGTVDRILPRNNEFDRPPIANVDLVVIVAAAKDPVPLTYVIDRMAVSAELKDAEIAICINKEDLLNEAGINEIESKETETDSEDSFISNESIAPDDKASLLSNESMTSDDNSSLLSNGDITSDHTNNVVSSISNLNKIYKDIYPVFNVSAKNGKGMAELKDFLKGKQAALAGPSGVGKSSLTNALLNNHSETTSDTDLLNIDIPSVADTVSLESQNIDALQKANVFSSEFSENSSDSAMIVQSESKNIPINRTLAEVGDISLKTLRGKNTTRHSELFLGDGFYLFDTPGFTSFETPQLDEHDLSLYFPEFEKCLGKCRFDNCMHLSEPDCAVKDAVNCGSISTSRYESYKSIFKELKERRKY